LRGEKRYYVYIMSSKGRVLYTGVTGFLMARVLQHKAGEVVGFVSIKTHTLKAGAASS